LKLGTKSLLFGAHQFLIHPVMVACGWYKLYGFPKDYRLWLAFILHDIGYIGCETMDGDDGKKHTRLGADIMGDLFGKDWHELCLYHSRFCAEMCNSKPSKLCFADKLAIAIEPSWLYLPRVMLSGEIKEYLLNQKNEFHLKNPNSNISIKDMIQWHQQLKQFIIRWVDENVDTMEKQKE